MGIAQDMAHLLGILRLVFGYGELMPNDHQSQEWKGLTPEKWGLPPHYTARP